MNSHYVMMVTGGCKLAEAADAAQPADTFANQASSFAKGLGSQLLAEQALTEGTIQYGNRAMFRSSPSAADVSLFDKLRDAAHNPQGGGPADALVSTDRLIRPRAGLFADIKHTPNYNMVTGQVNMDGLHDPHILAHELGHAAQIRRLTGITADKPAGGSFLRGLLDDVGRGHVLSSRLGLGVRALSTGGVAGFTNEDNARRAAVVANLSHVPLILNELDASHHGYKLLRAADPGMSRLKAMRSFSGVPTYAAGLSVPWAILALKKYLGGYHTPTESGAPAK